MSEENKQLVRRFFDEVMNNADVSRVEEFLAADIVDHESFPGTPPGVEGFRQFHAMMHAAFPDLRFEPEDLLAEGDKVVTRGTMSGTHQGQLLDIPPTGKHVTINFIDIVRFEGGKMAEHWGVTDQLGMMQQLGVVPMPEGAPASH